MPMPAVIELWHEGQRVAHWKYRCEAEDGSGHIYLHQQFKTAHAGHRMVAVEERTCMSDDDIRRLLQLPGVVVEHESVAAFRKSS